MHYRHLMQHNRAFQIMAITRQLQGSCTGARLTIKAVQQLQMQLQMQP